MIPCSDENPLSNDFYLIKCWFIYHVPNAWRICGKTGKGFTSHLKAQKTQSQLKPETSACQTKKQQQ